MILFYYSNVKVIRIIKKIKNNLINKMADKENEKVTNKKIIKIKNIAKRWIY